MSQVAGEGVVDAREETERAASVGAPSEPPRSARRRQAPHRLPLDLSSWRGRTSGAARWLLRPDLALTMVAAAVVRLWGIGSQSMWYDEWLTAKAATGSLYGVGQYVVGSAGIPPTYFGFMWGWARVVGDSDAALRSFSAVAGVAMVPLVYALAAELGQRRAVARLAGVLVAVNPMLVWYSQEARPYTLVAFLGGLSLWALARALTRGGRRELAVWAFVCALLFAVHYYAVFLVAIEVVALLAIRWPQRPQLVASVRARPRAWLVSLAPTGLLLGALAPFAVRQFVDRGQHGWIEDQDFGRRLRGVGTSLLVGPSQPTGRIWMIVAAVVGLAVVLLVVRGNLVERLVAAGVGIIGLGAIALALVAKLGGVDAVIERYLSVAFVPLVMVVAIGLGVSRVPGWVGGLAVALVSAVSLVVVVSVAQDPELQRSDWQAVARAHEAEATSPGARVLVMNEYGFLGRPLARYLDDVERLKDDAEWVRVGQIDVVASQRSSRPCNGLIGRSCNLVLMGDMPPMLWSGYEPAELADLSGWELEDLAALAALAWEDLDILADLAGVDLAEVDERRPAGVAQAAGLDPVELAELAGVAPAEVDVWEPVDLARAAGLGPEDLDAWVETVELDQVDIHRYELDQPRWLRRADLVKPRWDGDWKGLVLAPEDQIVDRSG